MLLDASDLDSLPDVEWVVKDLLPLPGLAVLFGEPGHGKSFLALDLALNVASGQDWRGFPVAQGPIVYIAAEGSRGLKSRVKAWREAHPGANIKGRAFLVFEAVMFHDRESLKRLTVALDRLPVKPKLIVVDTLAQNAVGVEENSAKDMGMWLHGAGLIRDRYEATVLVLHHTAKNGDRERGSGSLKGAVDTMMQMKKDAMNVLELTCVKQKDEEPFKPLHFLLQRVGTTGSAVLVLEDGPRPGPAPSPFEQRVLELATSDAGLTEAARMLVMEFPDVFNGKDPLGSAKGRLKRAKRQAEPL